jgi:hypothetical protein
MVFWQPLHGFGADMLDNVRLGFGWIVLKATQVGCRQRGKDLL